MINLIKPLCILFPIASLSASAYELRDCAPITSNSPAEARYFIKCLDTNIETLERERTIWINKIVMDMEELEAPWIFRILLVEIHNLKLLTL